VQQSTPEPPAGPDAGRRQVVVLSAVTVLAGGALAACSSGSAQSVGAASPASSDGTAADTAAVGPSETADGSSPESAQAVGPTTTAPNGAKAQRTTERSTTSSRSKATKKTSGKTSTKAPAEDFSQDALVKLSTVPVGGSVKIGGTIVTRTGSSSVVGHDTTCTHAGCSVMPVGRTLNCPCHGSKFDAVSGAVLAGPAPSPLPRVGLVVKGGYVHLLG
jgi:Rieske Fe-S protein